MMTEEYKKKLVLLSSSLKITQDETERLLLTGNAEDQEKLRSTIEKLKSYLSDLTV